MGNVDHLTSELPDPEAARRFIASLDEQHPRVAIKLRKNDGLLSDVLTLASYSPLLSTTLLQNPDYLWWLNRKRRAPAVRTKDELMEALGRFMLTHSQLDLHTQLARFRRRELLRIFLGDIRRLATIAEITEDISNLADAILETALRRARQEIDNRNGPPQVVDDKGRKTTAEFCIVSLGKLGSRELNYASDIDLLFLYSADGETAGTGTRGVATNREYFNKLGETIARLVGQQVGEGAAYRIDLRLRPHGRVGPLAISVADAVRYYNLEARDWERQVLIRSRSSAGDSQIYRNFFAQVERVVFVPDFAHEKSLEAPLDQPTPLAQANPVAVGISDEKTQHKRGGEAGINRREAEEGSRLSRPSVARALDSVLRSKQLIDLGQNLDRGFNVKLGRGGIREIEFIAQALQLAYGGEDRWLRVPHTLISLARLADRGHITESELTELYNAYEFLRRLEHVLQMENGLQTHSVPDDPDRRSVIARRMRCEDATKFDHELQKHAGNVHRVFTRVFGSELRSSGTVNTASAADDNASDLEGTVGLTQTYIEDSRPALDRHISESWTRQGFAAVLADSISEAPDFRRRLGAFRRRWSDLIGQIKEADLRNSIDIRTSKRAQTALAEASLDIALEITRDELAGKYDTSIDYVGLGVMGLGKLGGGAIDHGSDLDLVLVYDQDARLPASTTAPEFYGRAAEILVTTLSSVTRDGSIYRVDLRLRPYGKNGTSTISAGAFDEYMRDSAAIWEWLAYVKIRAVAGDMNLAGRVETRLREIIHARAADASVTELASETRRMRLMLEKQKAGRRTKDIDIKYGSGGMLDVYFAMRYLQLRDNVPDTAGDRSTEFMLSVLAEKGSLAEPDYGAMIKGYGFMSGLDHHLRLVVGRTTRLPTGNVKALEAVAARLGVASPAQLIEYLTMHRLDIRAAFEHVLDNE